MRRRIHQQLRLVPQRINHQHSRELQAIDNVLTGTPQVTELVYADLTRGVRSVDRGRRGLSADQVFRAALVRQMNGFRRRQHILILMDRGHEPPQGGGTRHFLKRFSPMMENIGSTA